MQFHDSPVLENRHVRLEPLSGDHHDDLVEAASDGALWNAWYTLVPEPEGMRAEIERRLALQQAGSMAPWVIVDAAGRVVGMTTYMNIDAANRHVEIGSTWMAASAQRTSVNPAAKHLLLGRAFDRLGSICVEFRTHWHNRQSRAAIEKLGAKQDGVLRNHQLMPDGGLRDTVVYSILPGEWPTVRAGLEHRLSR